MLSAAFDPLIARVRRRLDAAPPGALALGLSGGGDSVALLHIAADWAAARGRPLHALIVDHALREGSDAVAAQAAAAARAAGAEARVLRWAGPKPAHGVQAAARQARMALLCGAAAEAGAGALLLAHTLDDQAETVWQRAASGSGWRGLAGMRMLAPAPVWPQAAWDDAPCVLRPLLDVSRAELRALLTARGARWVEDPANADPRYARVRARAALAHLGPAVRDRLLAVAVRARELAERENMAARRLAATRVRCAPGGGFRVDPAALSCDESGAARLLRAVLCAAAGAEREASPAKAEAALERLRAGQGVTLGGAGAAVRRDGVLVHREAGPHLGRAGVAPAAAQALAPGHAIVWDGRFAVRARQAGLHVRALGAAGRDLPAEAAARLKRIPAPARAALPALWRDDVLAAAPHASFGADLATLRSLAQDRLERLLFADPAWFDGRGGAESLDPHWRNGI